jgi:hypothetical protein
MARSMINGRTQPLLKTEQEHIVRRVIPARLALAREHLNRPTVSYGDLAAAAILARSIASFLGLRRSRGGTVAEDRGYFEHDTGKTWEVKIEDIAGGRFVATNSLTQEDAATITAGILETNTAFAHLTYWPNPNTQTPDHAASEAYNRERQQRIVRFLDCVERLFNHHAAQLPKA